MTSPFLAAVLATFVAAFAPSQGMTYTARNGGNLVGCGALVGGPSIHHPFLTPVATNDSIAVTDPGGGGFPASHASAQFDTAPTPTSLTLAFSGNAHRGAPQSIIVALADCRDSWEFTLATPHRFTMTASLAVGSTEATTHPCHLTFTPFGGGAAIVPDTGSPTAPYQHTLTAPGSLTVAASGTMLPGQYWVNLFGRAEGATWPFTGSFTASFTLTLQPAATAVARGAFGNPNSYTCSAPLLGQTWNAAVDVSQTGHGFAMVFASLSPAHLPIASGFTVLLGGPVVEFLPITAGPQAAYSMVLPATPSLAGAMVFTQALHLGTNPVLKLSNSRDLTLGF
jgi:hypothetical protein